MKYWYLGWLWIAIEIVASAFLTNFVVNRTNDPAEHSSDSSHLPDLFPAFVDVVRVAGAVWSWLTVCCSLALQSISFTSKRQFVYWRNVFAITVAGFSGVGLLILAFAFIGIIFGSLFAWQVTKILGDFIGWSILLSFYAEAGGMPCLLLLGTLPNWFCAYRKMIDRTLPNLELVEPPFVDFSETV